MSHGTQQIQLDCNRYNWTTTGTTGLQKGTTGLQHVHVSLRTNSIVNMIHFKWIWPGERWSPWCSRSCRWREWIGRWAPSLASPRKKLPRRQNTTGASSAEHRCSARRHTWRVQVWWPSPWSLQRMTRWERWRPPGSRHQEWGIWSVYLKTAASEDLRGATSQKDAKGKSLPLWSFQTEYS